MRRNNNNKNLISFFFSSSSSPSSSSSISFFISSSVSVFFSSISSTFALYLVRADVTYAVDWTLKTTLLSYLHFFLFFSYSFLAVSSPLFPFQYCDWCFSASHQPSNVFPPFSFARFYCWLRLFPGVINASAGSDGSYPSLARGVIS